MRFKTIERYDNRLKKMMKAVDLIKNEIYVAEARQKPSATKPSGYMKGLQKALDILNEVMEENS